MFQKIQALYAAMQAGKQLQDADIWAHRANLQAVLAALITASVSLADAFGYKVEVGGTDVQSIALGLSTLCVTVSAVLHTASNPNAGKV